LIKENYFVREIPSHLTHDWLLHKHYARRIPSISFAFGLYDSENILQGVCTFGSPPSPALIQGLFNKKHTDIILELNRLCVNDGQDKNATSYFVSQCLKILPCPIVIVSYADTSQSHVGYIYQACNFIYTGLSAKRTEWKIEGLEHLHSKSISDGETLDSLKNKYGDKFYYMDRAQKHRYVYIIADKKQKALMLKELAYPIFPYPKGESKRYDASFQPTTQGVLI